MIRIRLRTSRVHPDDRMAQWWAMGASGAPLAPGETGELLGEQPAPPGALLQLVGHMHVNGIALDATLDGQPWHSERDWRHPVAQWFFPPRPFTGTVRLRCTYRNDTLEMLVDGPLARDMMCTLQGWVVP